MAESDLLMNTQIHYSSCVHSVHTSTGLAFYVEYILYCRSLEGEVHVIYIVYGAEHDPR